MKTLVEKSRYVVDAENIVDFLQGKKVDKDAYIFIRFGINGDYHYKDDDPCSFFLALFAFTADIISHYELSTMDEWYKKAKFLDEYRGIKEDNTTFPLNDHMLSMIASLSAEEEKQALEFINDFCLNYKINEYYCFTDGGWGDSLEMAYRRLTKGANERAKEALHRMQELLKDRKFMAEYCEDYVDFYEKHQAGQDLIDYRNWKSNIATPDLEGALERKMGEYMQDIIDSTFLAKCKNSVQPMYSKGENSLRIGNMFFSYDFRGFLTYLYDESHSFWKKEEARGFVILNEYSLTSWDSSIKNNITKLMLDNIGLCTYEVIFLILRFAYMIGRVGRDLEEIRKASDNIVYGYDRELRKHYEAAPENFKSRKAMHAWDEAVRLGYLRKCSARYKWAKKSITEFALFAYYAHQKLKISSYVRTDDCIPWKDFCSFFGVDYEKKKDYIKNIQTRIKEEKVSEKKKKDIENIFKNLRC